MKVALLFLTLGHLHGAAAAGFPDRPEGRLFGDWDRLDAERLEPVLIAHSNETGEQIFLAVLPEPTDLNGLARWWRVGEAGSNRGFLLVQTGSQIQCWSSEGDCPTLQAQSLGQAALDLLVKRESPVVDEEAYTQAAAHFGAPELPKPTRELPYAPLFLLGSLIAGGLLAALVLPRDAHYTPDGWVKVRTLSVRGLHSSPATEGTDGKW